MTAEYRRKYLGQRHFASFGLATALAVVTALAVAVPAGSGASSPGAPSPTSSASGGRTNYAAVKKRLSGYIHSLMAKDGVAGLSIALVDGRRVVMTRGFGVRRGDPPAQGAQRRTAKHDRVTARTLFHIGSVSKTFTAAAVMRLAERGRVDLDAPLARYVPRFSLLPRFQGNEITVRSVLDHHSGIPGDVFNGLITFRKPDPGFRAWLMKALGSMYPERPVNTVWAYNNSGYVLLQNLVRHVTGRGLQQYARRHLFRPMGMDSSTYNDKRPSGSRLTHNYQANYAPDGTLTGVEREPREYLNGWAAGSILSSAHDMAGYLRMLVSHGSGVDGRVLRPDTLRAMWTQQTRTPIDHWAPYRFGLGWFLQDPALDWAGPVRQHGGDTIWNHSMVKVLPRSRLAVFVSVNTTTATAAPSDVATRALQLAYTAKTGRHRPDPTPLPNSEPSSPTPTRLEALAGHYATDTGLDHVDVASGNDGLVWTRRESVDYPDDPQPAPTPAATAGTSATYRPYHDGWFRTTAEGWPQIAFRTVEGRRLMVFRQVLGTRPMTAIAGERVPESPIPIAWRARLGRYRAVNANPRTTALEVPKEPRLTIAHGVLVLDLGAAGAQVLQPTSPSLAFTFGLGPPLARGKGDSVSAFRTDAGREGFTYLGVRYLRTDTAKRRGLG